MDFEHGPIFTCGFHRPTTRIPFEYIQVHFKETYHRNFRQQPCVFAPVSRLRLQKARSFSPNSETENTRNRSVPLLIWIRQFDTAKYTVRHLEVASSRALPRPVLFRSTKGLQLSIPTLSRLIPGLERVLLSITCTHLHLFVFWRFSFQARNDRDLGSLALASDFGRIDVVRLLLAADADVEGRDCRGNTPLMHASREVCLLQKFLVVMCNGCGDTHVGHCLGVA